MLNRWAVLAAGAGAYITPAAMALPPLTRLLTRRTAGSMGRGHVCLTFDDGPHPGGTPAVLDILDDFGVTATFFLIAEQAERYPAVARQLVDRGHGVALHGYRHRLLLTQSPAAAAADIRRGHDSVLRITGSAPRWYRPPYGTASWSALLTARSLGMNPVWWTREGRDWSIPRRPEMVTDRLLRPDRQGRPRLDACDVLLLHDSDSYADPGSWRTTVAALPTLLSGIRAAGLRVGPLPAVSWSPSAVPPRDAVAAGRETPPHR